MASQILLSRPLNGYTTPSYTQDSFGNPMANLGFGSDSLMEGTEYTLTRLTNDYRKLVALYRNSWLVRRIVDTYPEDMLKNWITISTQVAPAPLDQLSTAEMRIGLRNQILKGLIWGGLFGGAIGIMLIKGQENQMDKPLDLRTVLPGCFKGLMVIDRWSGISPSLDLVSDIDDPDFTENMPEYFTVLGHTHLKQTKIHHSRIVRFNGLRLNWYEEVGNMYWGSSVIEPVYDELMKRDNVSANIANLVFQAKTTTMAMANIDQLLAGGDPVQVRNFWARMRASTVLRNNFGVQVIDTEDKVTQSQLSFSGLQGVYENVILDVCGAADIPCTRLFGRSATGLNATGEGDEKVYNGNVEKRQKTTVLPILNRLYPLLMVSTWGHIPDDYSIEFNPVRVSDIHDMARVAEFSERAVSDAYKNGLIDKATAMMELRAMKLNTGMFTNITDEMIDAARDIWVWDDAKKSDTMAYPSSGDRSIASTVDPNDEENNSALISGVGSGEG